MHEAAKTLIKPHTMPHQDQEPRPRPPAPSAAGHDGDEDTDDDPLALTISFPCQRARPPAQKPSKTSTDSTLDLPVMQISCAVMPPKTDPTIDLMPVLHCHPQPPQPVAVYPPATRARRNPNLAPRAGKPERIPPPFPWATDVRAHVHPLPYILSLGVHTVSDRMQCARCEKQAVLSYDVAAGFRDVAGFLAREQLKGTYDRAPPQLLHPAMPACGACGQAGSTRPVLPAKKREVNWLFLFLARALGCCNLKQLKYFCKHNGFHRTGAKDRVVYTAYVLICKQLDPASLPLTF